MIKCPYCKGKSKILWVYKSHNKLVPNKVINSDCDLCLGSGKLSTEHILELGFPTLICILSIWCIIDGIINKYYRGLFGGITFLLIGIWLFYLVYNRKKMLIKSRLHYSKK